MKSLKQPASLNVQLPPLPHQEPMPYTPDPEEVPGFHANSPIELPPPTVRRTLKARMHRRGPSQPLPVTDAWE